MAYRCDQAIFGGMRDAIRCKVSGSVCAHQKMCMMEGRMVLTDKATECPARGGQMPDDQGDSRSHTGTHSGNRETKAAKVVRAEKVPDIDAAADAQVKTRERKPAAKTAGETDGDQVKTRGWKPAAKTAGETDGDQVKTGGRKPAAATARKVTAKAETGTARKVTAKKTTTGRKKA